MLKGRFVSLIPTLGLCLFAAVASFLLTSLIACQDGMHSPTGPTVAPASESSQSSLSRRPSVRTLEPRPPVTTSGAATRIVNVGQSGGNSFADSQGGGPSSTIHVGDTVQWNWASGPHSATSGTCTSDYYGDTCNPDGNWDSDLQSPPFTFSHRFTTAGTYRYFCSKHGGMMTGTITVVP